MTLEILDEKGDRVRKLTSKKEEEEKGEGLDEEEGDYDKKKKEKEPLPVGAGLHRVVWDLRYEGPEIIKKAKEDGGDLKTGPLVEPGTYTIKLTADGKTETTKLEVRAALAAREASKGAGRVANHPGGRSHGRAGRSAQAGPANPPRHHDMTRTVEQLRAVKKQLEDATTCSRTTRRRRRW